MLIVKHSEEESAAPERRFQALVENSPDGVALLDARGKVLYVGHSFLGYAPEEWTGRRPPEVVHREDAQGVQRFLRELVSEPGRHASIEFRARRSDGEWRWIEAVCRNMLDDPAVAAILVNYRDITPAAKRSASLGGWPRSWTLATMPSLARALRE